MKIRLDMETDMCIIQPCVVISKQMSNFERENRDARSLPVCFEWLRKVPSKKRAGVFFSIILSFKRQIDSLEKKNITSASSEVYSEANSPKGNDPRRHLKELSDKWQLTAYLKKPASCLSVIKRPIKAIVFFLINLYRIIRSLTSGSKLCQTKGVGCV